LPLTILTGQRKYSLSARLLQLRLAAQDTLCRDIYEEFLRDLVVASRRHKDELLTAMLELLLSAPRALLRPAVSASEPMRSVLSQCRWYANRLQQRPAQALD